MSGPAKWITAQIVGSFGGMAIVGVFNLNEGWGGVAVVWALVCAVVCTAASEEEALKDGRDPYAGF